MDFEYKSKKYKSTPEIKFMNCTGCAFHNSGVRCWDEIRSGNIPECGLTGGSDCHIYLPDTEPTRCEKCGSTEGYRQQDEYQQCRKCGAVYYPEQPAQYTENPNPTVYNIDFDGTLTTGEYVADPAPRQEIIDRVRELYNQGHIILIWTARQWDAAPDMVSWLIKHRVPYHGVMMGKGGSGCYVDDKAIRPEEL